MDIRSRCEIETHSVPRCIIAAFERLKVAAPECTYDAAIVIGESVKKLRSRRELIIESTLEFGFMKRSAIASVENTEWSIENHRCGKILLEVFTGYKIEELVFFPRPTNTSTENLARIGIVLSVWKVGDSRNLIAKIAKDLAVKIIGSRFC